MAKAKERVNKRSILQLQVRFQKFCTRCDFSVTMRSVDAAADSKLSPREAVIASEAKQSIVTSCTERWIASLRSQ
jgi:hypothetical protein